ncbi:MAG TPA: endolytic transglycosylase MltG [Oligoflexia bacterium]|nr:endolytic transglycosylase MltG [Oligoflexia bacterium]HMP26928.1 endolytic transglycosylase MltG [Oligoflexia bacterium]
MKRIFKTAIIFLVPIFASFVAFVAMKFAFIEPINPYDSEEVLFEVAPGMTLKEISKRLERESFIRFWWSVCILAKIKKVDKQIRAGEYQLRRSFGPPEILALIISGRLYERKITFKEGASIRDLPQLVQDVGLLPGAEMEAALNNLDMVREAGLPESAKSFEGYLYPETYSFSRPTTAKQVIWTMLKEGERYWSQEFTKQAALLKMTRYEIMTLASIIEKESGVKLEEQPYISAVFHNRLKQGMKLQADPTVIYGIVDFDGNLTRADLERDTPYNTYTRFGLPPGPICNPSLSAIKAALYPAKTSALYFVADGSGGHVFSSTLDEHNAAVSKYILRR